MHSIVQDFGSHLLGQGVCSQAPQVLLFVLVDIPDCVTGRRPPNVYSLADTSLFTKAVSQAGLADLLKSCFHFFALLYL